MPSFGNIQARRYEAAAGLGGGITIHGKAYNPTMPDTRNWDELGGLMFTARRAVEGMYAGRHVSRRLGIGTDFHDYRPYVPGDDPARVDWKLFGRTDRHYIKRHVHHTDLHAYLLLDASASMRFAGLDRRGRNTAQAGSPSKWVYARQLAAAIAFLIVRQGDRVGVGMFDRSIHDHIPPGSGMEHLQRVVNMIDRSTVCEASSATDVGASLHTARQLMKRRGLVIVISDLLNEPAGLFDGLDRLRHDRFDAMVLQVLNPQERRLEMLPASRFELVDSETRDRVSTHVPTVATRYNRLMSAHITTLRHGCTARGMMFDSITTNQTIPAALRRILSGG